MPSWSFVGKPFRYQGGADPSADVDYGFKFTLRDETGREAKVNVECASGPSAAALTLGNAREAIMRYTHDPELPHRLVMSREGKFIPSS